MDGAFNALAAEKEKARQQKQEFDRENERRPSLSEPEREAERAVFKSLGLAMSIVFHVFGKRNELVRRAC